MAGHSQYKNIMHRKNAQDKIRSKIFTKLCMEITKIARKDPDPNTNSSLRNAIENARQNNLPNQNIKKAIERAKTSNAQDDETSTIEAKGHKGLFMMIEIPASMRIKLIPDIRKALNKHGWEVVNDGEISYHFTHSSIFIYEKDLIDKYELTEDKIYEIAIEYDIENIIFEDNKYIIIAPANQNTNLRNSFMDNIGPPSISEIRFISNSEVKVTDEQLIQSYNTLIDLLDAMPDVLSVYSNVDIDQ